MLKWRNIDQIQIDNDDEDENISVFVESNKKLNGDESMSYKMDDVMSASNSINSD